MKVIKDNYIGHRSSKGEKDIKDKSMGHKSSKGVKDRYKGQVYWSQELQKC